MVDELRSGQLEPGQSVLDAIERASGRKARVLLRDVPEEHSPLIRVPASGSNDEEAEDDRRYLILGEIARGGMGVVFKSRDKDLGREVAIKMLRKRFNDAPEVMERFVEEAQITGQLHNPGVVPIYDIGLQPDGRPYFVMKLVKGRTLAALLEERADPSTDRRRFLSVFEQICRTLAYAHARGVIHRDLKPSNIMLGAFGEVQVVDWGFAKVLGLQRDEQEEERAPLDMSVIATVRTGEGSSQSIAGSVMGTPGYMPPEQALGQIERLDERSDVFSLGAILCEILTGKPPYVAEPEDLLILAAQANLADAHARLDACGAHEELVALTKRCLQPLRRDRPANGGDVADGVAAHLMGVEERLRRADVESARERASEREESARLEKEAAAAEWEGKARRRVLVLAALLLVGALVGGGAYLFVQRDHEAQAERTTAAVRDAEDRARLLEGKAQWAEATAAAVRAARLAAQPEIDAETRARTESLRNRLEEKQRAAAEERARRERDALLVDRLAELQARWMAKGQQDRVVAEYETVFGEHGLDFKNPDLPQEIRSRPIARELVAALDDLSLLAPNARRWAIDADPDPWRTRVRRAASEAQRLIAIAKAPDVAARPVASLALLGHALIANGRADDAAFILSIAYHRAPSDYRVLALLADASARLGQWDQVTRHLTAALALRPGSVALRTRLGLALAQAGDLDAAVATLEDAKVHGLDLDGYCQLGRVLARKGDRKGALGAFRAAMKLNPGSSVPHHALGVALVRSFQDYEGAIAAFKESLRIDAQSPETHRNLAIAYDKNGDPNRALDALDAALRLNPDYIAARESRGIVLAGQHRYLDAIKEYLAVIEKEPRRGAVHYHLARAYLATARYRAALSSFLEARRLGFDNRYVDVYRGQAYERLGKLKEAVFWIGKSMLEHKNFAEAEYHLGRAMFRRGDHRPGLVYSRRAHENGKALGKAWAFPSAEQVARQERQTKIIQRLNAKQPPGQASLDVAAVYFWHKRWEEAGRVYMQLIPLPPGDDRLQAVASAVRAAQNRALPAKERAARRGVGLAWMKRELKHWRPLLAQGDHVAYRTLMDWKEGWLLEPVQPARLDRLPDEDRAAWQAFWRDVDAALAEAEK